MEDKQKGQNMKSLLHRNSELDLQACCMMSQKRLENLNLLNHKDTAVNDPTKRKAFVFSQKKMPQ
jgi:hypothetical protein